MGNNTTLYSKRTKVAELIADDNDLLSILQRLGIRLGFGETTVDEMCRRYNLSTELFLIICNIPAGIAPLLQGGMLSATAREDTPAG